MSADSIALLDHSRPEVAEEIHQVMMAAYQVEAELLGVSDFVPLQRTVMEIRAANSLFLGACPEHRLAAVAEIEAGQDSVNIGSLVVTPEHFRQGLGTAVVRHAIARYADRDMTVSTGVRNLPAISLYLGLGFRRGHHWTTEDGIPMVTLIRKPGRRVPAGDAV